jgi:hypothetical protein
VAEQTSTINPPIAQEQVGWWFTGSDDDIHSDNPYDRFVHISDVDDEHPLNPQFAEKCVPVFIGGGE